MDDTQFAKLVESTGQKIKELQTKNDEIQTEIEADDVQVADLQEKRQDIVALIETLKKDIHKLEQSVGHLAPRTNKLKTIKNNYQKQVEKSKSLGNDLENKLKALKKPSQQGTSYANTYGKSQSNDKMNSMQPAPIQQEEQLIFKEEDIDLTQQLLVEKNAEIDHIHQQVHMVNKVANELAIEVDNQDMHLDLVQINFNNTKENLQQGGQQLAQAQVEQQSANKKYLIIAFLAVVLVGVLLVLIFKDDIF